MPPCEGKVRQQVRGYKADRNTWTERDIDKQKQTETDRDRGRKTGRQWRGEVKKERERKERWQAETEISRFPLPTRAGGEEGRGRTQAEKTFHGSEEDEREAGVGILRLAQPEEGAAQGWTDGGDWTFQGPGACSNRKGSERREAEQSQKRDQRWHHP